MATSRKDKEASLAAITEMLKNARSVVFSEYRGMTVKQLDNVRNSLRKEEVKYQVVKVTLLKKAMTALGMSTEGFKYSGPVAIAISENEETAPARILKGLMKENPQIVFDGGVFNKEFVDAAFVTKIASIPTKQQLLGQLVYVLTGNVRGLLYALSAIKDKKQEGEAPAPTPAPEPEVVPAPEPTVEAVAEAAPAEPTVS